MKEKQSRSYRMLFEQSPVSLWVEDFSGVYEYIEAKKAEGIEDFRSFFEQNPAELELCISSLRINSINNATLKIFQVRDLEELMQNLHLIFKDDAKTCFLESIISLAENKKSFDGQGINYNLAGEKLHLRISWNIAGDSPEDLKSVVVALQDLSNLERMREELAARETIFRLVFEKSSDGLILVDKSGRIFLSNQMLTELSGISQQELAGSYLWDFLDGFYKSIQLEGEIPICKDNILSVLSDPSGVGKEVKYSFFDDKHKLHAFHQFLMPILAGDEPVFLMLLADRTYATRSATITSILHKISHSVNIECSLEELYGIIHESLSKLMDTTNFFIAQYDDKTNIVTFPYLVDEMDEDSSPIEADESASLTAQIISEAIPMLMGPEEIKKRSLETGLIGVECENMLGVPLIMAGKVIGAIVLQSYRTPDLYDIEDLKLLESISEQIAYALHKKQSDEEINVLLQAIEQAGEGIIIFNPHGNIRYVNTIFERMTLYRRSELLDKPFEYLPFDMHSQKEMQQSWLRVRSSQPWRGNIDLYRKDGPKITLDMVVKPVIDADGKLSSIIASCKDVTYELLREEQQKRTQRLESIGRLTGGIAHDFNNILSAIIGYTELAGDDMEPESDAAQNLMEVLRSAGRAKEMISQLISFSRQEEAKTEILELVDHVRESVRFLRSYLPRSIKISERYTQEQCTVVAVPGQIHQIIINLGTNAMHALQKEGAKLEIGVESISFDSKDMKVFPELDQCQYMKITVADNGTGIDPGILDHIFDPYFTTKSANEGSGLGLSIVHSIVQSHRGAIRIESEIGKGTTFSIYLPLYMPDTSLMPSEQTEEEETSISGTETIMVVDDEPALVSVFRQGLMRLGYRVEGFTDPRKALDHFNRNQEKIDIVVTDTTMPFINGVDLAERMMKIRNVPVILCTGFTTLISVDDAREKGIRDFVMKPFKIRDIATRIREILDSDETGHPAK